MYLTNVIAIRERQCALRLVPEQPDCMPYYVSPEFGVATLWHAGQWAGGGDLVNEISSDSVDEMIAGTRDGATLVESVMIHNVHGFPWTHEATSTAADYVITVTDERWLRGIEVGHRFENHAYCQHGAFLSPIKPEPSGAPMPWWFAGRAGTRPKEVIRDLDVLQMLKAAGIE